MKKTGANQIFCKPGKRHSCRHLKSCLVRFLLFVSVVAGVTQANEVTLPYKGLTLNANLELASGRALADGAVLITHGGLAHRNMELIAGLQDLLKDRGYNTLAINLSLGLDNRHGMYDCRITHRHRNQDAADEIGAWVSWLQKQGARRVVLLGHSRGGAQTALYAAEHGNGLIKAVALMAPAVRENSDAETYMQRNHKKLSLDLEKARNLVTKGKGGAAIEHIGMLNCSDTSATADSFISYYAQDAKVDTPSLFPKIRQPTMVIVAGSDGVVVGLEKKLAATVNGSDLKMKIIDGADHTFRDLYAEDAVDAIDAFLKELGYMKEGT